MARRSGGCELWTGEGTWVENAGLCTFRWPTQSHMVGLQSFSRLVNQLWHEHSRRVLFALCSASLYVFYP